MESIPLISNVLQNTAYLASDFQSFFPSLSKLCSIFLSLCFVISIFFLLYLFGERVRSRYFHEINDIRIVPFLNLALGYVSIGTVVAILGSFSLFTFPILVSFFVIICLVSLFPLTIFQTFIYQIKPLVAQYKQQWRAHAALSFITYGFVILGFLRLIPSETNVDALWYHTDLPHAYVREKTMMIEPNYQYHLVPIPQLSEMFYVVAEILSIKDAGRYIHWMFYVSVVLLLSVAGFKKKYYLVSLLVVIFFVSAPVTIRHASSTLANFQWMLCWLLAIYILHKKKSATSVVLSGILLGGVFATKRWTFAFIPVFFFFLFWTERKSQVKFKFTFFFLITSMIVPAIWYVRSYLLTGNPVYPAFSGDEWFFPQVPGISSYISVEALKFRLASLLNWSPLFLLSVPVCCFYLVKNKPRLSTVPLLTFLGMLSISYLILPFYFGHYLYPWYLILVISIGYVTEKITAVNRLFLTGLTGAAFVLLLYYGINTILFLPYGLGMADENKYLTRILSRDNSSYYDYGYRFSKWYTQNEPIGTYGLWGFYYASFEPKFVIDEFRKYKPSLQVLKKQGIHKLIIKGGNIEWFCNNLHVKDCYEGSYELLAKYEFLYAPASQYLYALK